MNDLQRDLLTEGLSDFEQTVLSRTVSAARQARRKRKVFRYGTAVAAIACASLLWFPRDESHTITSRPAVIQSASLAASPPASRVVTIRTKEFPRVIRTHPLPAEQRLHSFSDRITVFHTSELKPEIRLINDEQLLSLFAGQTVALIGRGPDATLIFPEEP